MIHLLTIEQFRNLLPFQHGVGEVNLLIGDNGSGKTSVLEALYYSTYLNSFRTSQQDQLVQWDASYFLLAVSEQQQAIRICRFRERESEIKLDNTLCKNRKDALARLSPRISATVLSPHLESLINAEPNKRRQWLDKAMFHMEHDGQDLVARYERALFNRNTALKKKHYKDDDFWLHQLTLAGIALTEKRQACFMKLEKQVQKWLSLIGFEHVHLDFYRGWPDGENLLNQYYKQIPEDRANGFTKMGAHKADIHIYWHKQVLAKQAASRGQNKLLHFALLCAELESIYAHVATRLFLLDDIASEFDDKNLQHICQTLLPELDAQLFITAIEYNKHFDLLCTGSLNQRFMVQDGKTSSA